MSASPTDAASVSRSCGNCGAPMLGDHCYRCGQPVKGLVRHFSSIIGDFLDSVFDFDSRTFRTIGPLFYRPGYLSNEYIAGRRVRYVSPVRLFVFLCIVSFFTLRLWVDPDMTGAVRMGGDNFANLATVEEVEKERDEALADMQKGREELADSPAGMAGIDAGIDVIRDAAQRRIDELTPTAEREADSIQMPSSLAQKKDADSPSFSFGNGVWDAEKNPVGFDLLPDAANAWLNQQIGRAKENAGRVKNEPRLLVESVMQTLPQTFFVLLPIFALLLKFMYLFKRRLYMEHLIVALHSHAFLCVCLLLVVGLSELRELLTTGLLHSIFTGAERLLLLWMPVYLWLVLKRVYRQGWFFTCLKYCLLGLAYVVLLSLAALFNLAFNLGML